MPFDINSAKKFFFDRAAVQNAVSAGERKALAKFGAHVRQRDRTSIRQAPMADAQTGLVVRGRRKKGQAVKPAVSRPGKPPYSHEGSLRRLILFAYDPGAKSVVIGPVPFKRGEAPALLEYGGPAVRRSPDGVRSVYYRARPHTGPAFKAELPKAPQVFKDCIR